MTAYQNPPRSTSHRRTRPPTRPPTRRPRLEPATVLIALAVVLGSTGFAFTLLPGAGGPGVVVLIGAGLLLLHGLHLSVRADLDTLSE